MSLPDPDDLSLSGALVRIKSTALSIRGSAVARWLFGMLCDGKLSATGDLEDRNGGVIARAKVISPEDWRSIDESEFFSAIDRDRVLNLRPDAASDLAVFVVRVRIKTEDLDELLMSSPSTETMRKPSDDKNDATRDKSIPIEVSNGTQPRSVFKNKTGPRSVKKQAATEAMISAVKRGQLSRDELIQMPEKRLCELYSEAKRTTLREARDDAVKQLLPRQNSDKSATNDK
jgi:hypothetical protein